MAFFRNWDNRLSNKALSTVGRPKIVPLEDDFPWKRNPCWLSLPEVANTDQEVVGLYAVEPDSSFCSLTIGLDASGEFYVDWGDGTSNTGTTSGTTQVTVHHQYDFNDSNLANTDGPVIFNSSTYEVERENHGYDNGDLISFSTITDTTGVERFLRYFVVNKTSNTFQISSEKNGDVIEFSNNGSGTLLYYKQAIIQVTTQVGRQIRVFNNNVRHTLNNQFYESGWLDLSLSLPSATSITFGASGSQIIRHSMLEHANLLNLGNITSFIYGFRNNFNLQKVEDITLPSQCTNISFLFNGARNLYYSPNIFNTSQVTNFAALYLTCSSLRKIPNLDTSNATSITSILQDCFDLKSFPKMDFSKVTSLASVFYNTHALTDMPPLDTSNVTDFTNAIRSCYSLLELPFLDTKKGTNFSTAFYFNYSAKSLPAYNLSSATILTNFLNGCNSIKELPPFDFSNATTLTNAFNGCRSLKKTYNLNFNSATAATGLFYFCTSLRIVPTLSFGEAKLTSAADMFRSCTNLTSVPLFDTSLCNSFGNTFNGCGSLKYIPPYNTSNVITFSSAFSGCLILRETPNIDMSNATNIDSLFLNCVSLKYVPKYNWNSVTSSSSALSGLYTNRIAPINLPSCTNLTSLFNGSLVISYLPKITLGASNITATRLFYNCISLMQVPSIDMSGITGLTDTYVLTNSLKSIKATGMKVSFTLATHIFSSTALNEIYTNLATVSGQTITVTTNWGTSSDTPSIATSKGWTVTGT